MSSTLSGKGLSSDQSPALRTSGVTKAAGGQVFAIYVQNSSGSVEYLHVFNLAAVPADGVAPQMCYPIQPAASQHLQFQYGDSFTTGICWAESTTQATKTIAGTPKFTVKIDYR